jgi:hypothetical protein
MGTHYLVHPALDKPEQPYVYKKCTNVNRKNVNLRLTCLKSQATDEAAGPDGRRQKEKECG